MKIVFFYNDSHHNFVIRRTNNQIPANQIVISKIVTANSCCSSVVGPPHSMEVARRNIGKLKSSKLSPIRLTCVILGVSIVLPCGLGFEHE